MSKFSPEGIICALPGLIIALMNSPLLSLNSRSVTPVSIKSILVASPTLPTTSKQISNRTSPSGMLTPIKAGSSHDTIISPSVTRLENNVNELILEFTFVMKGEVDAIFNTAGSYETENWKFLTSVKFSTVTG